MCISGCLCVFKPTSVGAALFVPITCLSGLCPDYPTFTRVGHFGYIHSDTAMSHQEARDYCSTTYPGATLPVLKDTETINDVVKAVTLLAGAGMHRKTHVMPYQIAFY